MESASAGDVRSRVWPIAERVAASRGLEVFDISFRRESRGLVLRIFLDKPTAPAHPGRAGAAPADGVTIEDCRAVSEEVGTILDVEDVIGGTYLLEVSSPGLDRPLRHAGDYRRFAGCLAKIVVSEAVDGQKYVRGRLQGMEGDDVLVADAKGKTRRVPLTIIVRAQLEVEF